jgi:hypothetical protein
MAGVLKDLGPCEVKLNAVDLGYTRGSVSFRYTVEDRDILEDQKGVTPVDGQFVGATCEVTVPLTRQGLSILASVIPGATYDGKLKVSAPVYNRYENASALTLTAIVDGVASSLDSDKLTIHKASPSADLDITFDNEGQRVYNIVFKGYPSQTSPVGEIWRIGA